MEADLFIDRTDFEEFCSDMSITGIKSVDRFNGEHYEEEFDFTFDNLLEDEKELNAAIESYTKANPKLVNISKVAA